MEGQVKVVPALVGLLDGAAGGHLRCVADVADAAAVEVGNHRVGQPIHVELLAAAAGDVSVALLCGRAEINDRHDKIPPGPVYAARGPVVCWEFVFYATRAATTT